MPQGLHLQYFGPILIKWREAVCYHYLSGSELYVTIISLLQYDLEL